MKCNAMRNKTFVYVLQRPWKILTMKKIQVFLFSVGSNFLEMNKKNAHKFLSNETQNDSFCDNHIKCLQKRNPEWCIIKNPTNTHPYTHTYIPFKPTIAFSIDKISKDVRTVQRNKENGKMNGQQYNHTLRHWMWQY